MFTSSSIIDNLNKSEGLEYKKLCRLLKITKKSDKDKLDIALTALEKLEIINKNENDEYTCIKDNDHLVAKIRCSSKGYCFAVRGKDKEDIYIKENLLNYAWNGDKVLVRIIKEGYRRRSPEGIVDCILERSNQILLSKVEIINNDVYAIPIDDRILSKIKLPKENEKYTFNPDNKNIVIGKKILILEADGCPYCYKLRQDVLNNYQGSLEIFYRKSDELDEIELKTPTWATPTIYFLENGTEVWSHQGYLSNQKFYKSLGKFKLGETEAYNVAFNQGTDPTYCKEYELFKNTPEGLFVDKLSGAPLFDTRHRFNSKTGWLSFTEAVKDSVTEHMDYSYGMVRVEIRSKSSGIHLGHVFNDGPNGKPRYCINATVLEFVPNLDT